jgi:outer membrane lipoprotein-sorting protein
MLQIMADIKTKHAQRLTAHEEFRMNKLTKTAVFLFLCLTALALAGCATAPAKAQGITLDQAIQEASANIETSLSPGTKAAILYFTSPSEAFSEYVLEELSTTLVNGRKIMIVDRKNLDAIRAELNFNMSGEVSDESAQTIGRMLGAQSIVFGTLSVMGGVSRFRVKTINTESANIEASSSVNIVNDEQVEILLAGGGNATGPQYGNATAQTKKTAGSGGQTAQTPALSDGPGDGTYTFWPRPQASSMGKPINTFIAQIVYTEDYTVIYFARKAEGDFSNGSYGWDWDTLNKITLQDLDSPSKFYQPVDANYTHNGMGASYSISFNRLPVRRFKLWHENTNPVNGQKATFYEVIIPKTPDA